MKKTLQECKEIVAKEAGFKNWNHIIAMDVGIEYKVDLANKMYYEQSEDTTYNKVRAVTDESGHWYIIPNELCDDFREDLYNNDMCDSGEFDDKYGKYRTSGDLNLIQLYINPPQK